MVTMQQVDINIFSVVMASQLVSVETLFQALTVSDFISIADSVGNSTLCEIGDGFSQQSTQD